MNPHDPKHLTADELDAFLTDSTSHLVASHLATCSACAAMVEADGTLIAALSALPAFDPQPGFADRVLRQLDASPVAVPVVASPRSLAARRRARAGALVVTGSIAAGFTWAMTGSATALRWSASASASGHAVWVSLQSVANTLSAQSWTSPVRDVIATPGRAATASLAVAAAYGVLLTVLSRLMAEPTPDAGW
jgi:anti-sigma factor RsiW